MRVNHHVFLKFEWNTLTPAPRIPHPDWLIACCGGRSFLPGLGHSGPPAHFAAILLNFSESLTSKQIHSAAAACFLLSLIDGPNHPGPAAICRWIELDGESPANVQLDLHPTRHRRHPILPLNFRESATDKLGTLLYPYLFPCTMWTSPAWMVSRWNAHSFLRLANRCWAQTTMVFPDKECFQRPPQFLRYQNSFSDLAEMLQF